MIYELIAAVVAAFAAAGVALLVRKLIPATPSYLVPVAAGGAMIAFGVWAEYNWYPRTAASLPEGVEVLQEVPETSFFRPWTFAAPYVTRFAAVDVAAAKRNDAAPGKVMVDIYLFARYVPAVRVPVMVDCPGERRADVLDGLEFADDGSIATAVWTPLPPTDPLWRTVCAEGVSSHTE